MDLLKKLLLGYCSLFAIFLFLSGILSSKTPQELIPQLVFLPVAAFFVFTLVSSVIKRKNVNQPDEHADPKPKSSFKRSSLVLIVVILVILLSVSVFNIINKSSLPASVNGINTQQADTKNKKEGMVIPSSKTKTTIRIIADTDATTVNIRDAASVSAKIISKTHRDEEFSVIAKNGDWFKVTLKDGTTGFIHTEFATEIKKDRLTK